MDVLHTVGLYLFVSLFALSANATDLTNVSDTVSTSAPGAGANHTILFTTTTELPASGTITITPEANDFTIPGSFGLSDIDLLVGGVQQTIASSPGSGTESAWGATVTSGVNGTIVFTRNDTDALAAASNVEVRLGTHAVSGGTGAAQITNPSVAGQSYTMSIATATSAPAALDSFDALVFIIESIGQGTGDVSDTPDCNDGVDNDGDGQTDFPADSGCDSAADTSEVGTGGGGSGAPSGLGTQLSPSFTSPGFAPADITQDGRVDLADYSVVLAHWGVTGDNEADLNGDGVVDLVDLSIVLYWWTDV